MNCFFVAENSLLSFERYDFFRILFPGNAKKLQNVRCTACGGGCTVAVLCNTVAHAGQGEAGSCRAIEGGAAVSACSHHIYAVFRQRRNRDGTGKGSAHSAGKLLGSLPLGSQAHEKGPCLGGCKLSVKEHLESGPRHVGVQILMAGIDVGDDNIIYLRDEGFDIPEDGVYTTEEYYNSHRDIVERFVEATRRGWKWVRKPENFSETINTVTDIMRQANIPSSKTNQAHMLRTVLKLQQDDKSKDIPFHLDKSRFDSTVRMLLENNLILSPVKYSDFVRP